MFTVDQITAAHSKVKSGSDFPGYMQEIIKLGVTGFETYVTDGHTDYYGKEGYSTSSVGKYEKLLIEDACNIAQFMVDLKAHQQGKTDYKTFCADCAKSGVEKWAVSTDKMTCIYYDKAGNEVLVEVIPSA